MATLRSVLFLLLAAGALAAAGLQTSRYQRQSEPFSLTPSAVLSAASRFVCVVACDRAQPAAGCDGVTYHANGTCRLLSGAAGTADQTAEPAAAESSTYIRLPRQTQEGTSTAATIAETRSTAATVTETKPSTVTKAETKPSTVTNVETQPTSVVTAETKPTSTVTAETKPTAAPTIPTTATTAATTTVTTTTTTSTSPSTTAAPVTPPSGFSTCSGIYLRRLTSSVSYSKAEALCAELAAHLVVPRTAEQNECALKLAGGIKAWIGVTDRLTEGTFVAADGRGPLEKTFWDFYSPNNYGGAQNCGELYFDDSRLHPEPGWNDITCDVLRNPMCQWRP